MRHPFYVSYLIYWVAAACSAPYLEVVIGVGLIAALYVRLATREERYLMASPLGADYRAYQRRSGRFFPHWPASP